jgi:hypothetical protein
MIAVTLAVMLTTSVRRGDKTAATTITTMISQRVAAVLDGSRKQ